MKRACRPKVIAVLALITVLSGTFAATIFAAGYVTTIHAGNLVVRLDGAITPKALPKDKMAPISFHASASVATVNGDHVPPALSTHLQVDKHITIDSTGLPSCTPGKIEATSPANARKACGPALIGKGTSSAQVEFPESEPFSAKGPLLAFNGPSTGGGYGGHGYPEQLYYIYVDVPVPTALVVVAKLSKDTGRYGYRISVSIPQIAGGSGSLTAVEFTINRKWTYKGQQYSYLNAECADGRFYAQVETAFGGGTNLSGALVNSCQSKG